MKRKAKKTRSKALKINPPDVYIPHPESRPGHFVLGHWRKRRKGEQW